MCVDVHGHKHIAQPVVCMKKLNCAHMSHTDRLECELTNPKKKPPPQKTNHCLSVAHQLWNTKYLSQQWSQLSINSSTNKDQ